MNRKILNKSIGFRTQDGAGVKLTRILSNQTVRQFDPFLMLDSFDSKNPDDYTKGFPMHPHRGIETISYVVEGAMEHRDSIGNNDTVGNGEIQWMTAGSGIMHEERVPARERMLGAQLWLNLRGKDKMVPPKYHAIKNHEIEKIDIGVGTLNLLVGNYNEHKGYQSEYLPLDYYDIELKPDKIFELETDDDRFIMLFTLIGEVEVEGELIEEKTAVSLSKGDKLVIKSLDSPTHLLLMSSIPTNENVAWGGPIVMNTEEEVRQAFKDLKNGTFIKERIVY